VAGGEANAEGPSGGIDVGGADPRGTAAVAEVPAVGEWVAVGIRGCRRAERHAGERGDGGPAGVDREGGPRRGVAVVEGQVGPCAEGGGSQADQQGLL